MISRLTVSDFVEMLGRYENQTSEAVFQFPLEFYATESSFLLYKTIMSKVYSTEVIIDKSNNITLNGEVMTTDSFITTFLRNHNAIQVLQPLDTNANVSLTLKQE